MFGLSHKCMIWLFLSFLVYIYSSLGSYKRYLVLQFAFISLKVKSALVSKLSMHCCCSKDLMFEQNLHSVFVIMVFVLNHDYYTHRSSYNMLKLDLVKELVQ